MRNGKRIYVSAFKAWLVEQALKPDVSVAGLALRHGVNANQLRSWMKLEHWQSSPHTLLPVTVVADARPAEAVATTNARQPKAVMEIEVCGTVIRLRVDADRKLTHLRALGGADVFLDWFMPQVQGSPYIR